MGAASLQGSLLLMAFIIHTVLTAPVIDDNTALLGPDQIAEGNGCYYNYEHYEEGDRILTNEPCLNCTCHNRMLMCYLRVCPFTKAIGQDCKVEKKPDQCCPVITCPQVHVALLTSSTTETASASTALGHPDNYGCVLDDNTFYADGAQVPSDPKKPCELCYCIRNQTACVMQECTLNVEGCKPVYQEGVCCPVRYDCDYDQASATTPSGLITTPGGPNECLSNSKVFYDGELIDNLTDKPCEHCYCMRGKIVCAVQDCGTPLENTECTPMEREPGQCCPSNYRCPNGTIPANVLKGKPQTSLDRLSITEKPADEEKVAETEAPSSGEDAEEGEQQPESDSAPEANEAETVEVTSEGAEEQAVIEIITTVAPSEDVPEEQAPSEKLQEHKPEEVQEASRDPEPIEQEHVQEAHPDHDDAQQGHYAEATTAPPYTEISVENVEMNTSPPEITKPEQPTVDSSLLAQPSENIAEPEAQEPTTSAPYVSGAHSSDDADQAHQEPESPETPSEPQEPSAPIVQDVQETTQQPTTTSTSTTEALPEPEEMPRIPGEGSCLHLGITYAPNTEVPSANSCKRCRCINSIVTCSDLECPEPPISLYTNCVPMPPTDDACCPTYFCEQKPSAEPEADNQMSIDKIDHEVHDDEVSPEFITTAAPAHEEETSSAEPETPVSESHDDKPTDAQPEATQPAETKPESDSSAGLEEAETQAPVEAVPPHHVEPESSRPPVESDATHPVESEPAQIPEESQPAQIPDESQPSHILGESEASHTPEEVTEPHVPEQPEVSQILEESSGVLPESHEESQAPVDLTTVPPQAASDSQPNPENPTEPIEPEAAGVEKDHTEAHEAESAHSEEPAPTTPVAEVSQDEKEDENNPTDPIEPEAAGVEKDHTEAHEAESAHSEEPAPTTPVAEVSQDEKEGENNPTAPIEPEAAGVEKDHTEAHEAESAHSEEPAPTTPVAEVSQDEKEDENNPTDPIEPEAAGVEKDHTEAHEAESAHSEEPAPTTPVAEVNQDEKQDEKNPTDPIETEAAGVEKDHTEAHEAESDHSEEPAPTTPVAEVSQDENNIPTEPIEPEAAGEEKDHTEAHEAESTHSEEPAATPVAEVIQDEKQDEIPSGGHSLDEEIKPTTVSEAEPLPTESSKEPSFEPETPVSADNTNSDGSEAAPEAETQAPESGSDQPTEQPVKVESDAAASEVTHDVSTIVESNQNENEKILETTVAPVYDDQSSATSEHDPSSGPSAAEDAVQPEQPQVHGDESATSDGSNVSAEVGTEPSVVAPGQNEVAEHDSVPSESSQSQESGSAQDVSESDANESENVTPVAELATLSPEAVTSTPEQATSGPESASSSSFAQYVTKTEGPAEASESTQEPQPMVTSGPPVLFPDIGHQGAPIQIPGPEGISESGDDKPLAGNDERFGETEAPVTELQTEGSKSEESAAVTDANQASESPQTYEEISITTEGPSAVPSEQEKINEIVGTGSEADSGDNQISESSQTNESNEVLPESLPSSPEDVHPESHADIPSAPEAVPTPEAIPSSPEADMSLAPVAVTIPEAVPSSAEAALSSGDVPSAPEGSLDVSPTEEQSTDSVTESIHGKPEESVQSHDDDETPEVTEKIIPPATESEVQGESQTEAAPVTPIVTHGELPSPVETDHEPLENAVLPGGEPEQEKQPYITEPQSQPEIVPPSAPEAASQPGLDVVTQAPENDEVVTHIDSAGPPKAPEIANQVVENDINAIEHSTAELGSPIETENAESEKTVTASEDHPVAPEEPILPETVISEHPVESQPEHVEPEHIPEEIPAATGAVSVDHDEEHPESVPTGETHQEETAPEVQPEELQPAPELTKPDDNQEIPQTTESQPELVSEKQPEQTGDDIAQPSGTEEGSEQPLPGVISQGHVIPDEHVEQTPGEHVEQVPEHVEHALEEHDEQVPETSAEHVPEEHVEHQEEHVEQAPGEHSEHVPEKSAEHVQGEHEEQVLGEHVEQVPVEHIENPAEHAEQVPEHVPVEQHAEASHPDVASQEQQAGTTPLPESEAAPEQPQVDEAEAAPEQPQVDEAEAAPEKPQVDEAEAAPEKPQVDESEAAPEKTQVDESEAAPEKPQVDVAEATPEKPQVDETEAAPEKPQVEEAEAAPEHHDETSSTLVTGQHSLLDGEGDNQAETTQNPNEPNVTEGSSYAHPSQSGEISTIPAQSEVTEQPEIQPVESDKAEVGEVAPEVPVEASQPTDAPLAVPESQAVDSESQPSGSESEVSPSGENASTAGDEVPESVPFTPTAPESAPSAPEAIPEEPTAPETAPEQPPSAPDASSESPSAPEVSSEQPTAPEAVAESEQPSAPEQPSGPESSSPGDDEPTSPEDHLPSQPESSHIETEKEQPVPESPSSQLAYSSQAPPVEVPSTEGPAMAPGLQNWSQKPAYPQTHPEVPHLPEDSHYPSPPYDQDYEDEDSISYGPGTCRYGGKVYLSAQQIPRDDPCDFCFCFRSDIICLQQSCPPPIKGCYQEIIKGFCCPRYECHVSMATMVNITTTSTTTTTTVPPHFLSHHYNGSAMKAGCQVKGIAYRVGDRIPSTSGPCLDCRCGADGQMKCDPTNCGPQESLLRQVMAASVARKRRR